MPEVQEWVSKKSKGKIKIETLDNLGCKGLLEVM